MATFLKLPEQGGDVYFNTILVTQYISASYITASYIIAGGFSGSFTGSFSGSFSGSFNGITGSITNSFINNQNNSPQTASFWINGTGSIERLIASNLKYPISDGSPFQSIVTDGAGNLFFYSISGSGGSGSIDTSIFVVTSSFHSFTQSIHDFTSSINAWSSSLIIPDTSSLQTQITNVFVSQSNYTLTSSFQPFTTSIHNFTSSINTQVSNVFLSQSRYVLTSSISGTDNYIALFSGSRSLERSIMLQDGNIIIVSGNVSGSNASQPGHFVTLAQISSSIDTSIFVLTSSFQPFTQSIHDFTASLNAWSSSLNEDYYFYNLGSGSRIVRQIDSQSVGFKSFTSGSGIIISSSDDEIHITFSGSISIDTSSLQTQITNVFTSQSNYTLTSSFQSFTSSINTQVSNVFISQSRYTLTSSFQSFTASIHTFTSSINTQVNNVFLSQSQKLPSSSVSGSDNYLAMFNGNNAVERSIAYQDGPIIIVSGNVSGSNASQPGHFVTLAQISGSSINIDTSSFVLTSSFQPFTSSIHTFTSSINLQITNVFVSQSNYTTTSSFNLFTSSLSSSDAFIRNQNSTNQNAYFIITGSGTFGNGTTSTFTRVVISPNSLLQDNGIIRFSGNNFSGHLLYSDISTAGVGLRSAFKITGSNNNLGNQLNSFFDIDVEQNNSAYGFTGYRIKVSRNASPSPNILGFDSELYPGSGSSTSYGYRSFINKATGSNPAYGFYADITNSGSSIDYAYYTHKGLSRFRETIIVDNLHITGLIFDKYISQSVQNYNFIVLNTSSGEFYYITSSGDSISIDTSSLQTQITNVFTSQSNYTLTSSFQSFTQSIHTLTSSINTQVNNVFLSQSRYTLTSSFQPFTSSIHTFTSSINAWSSSLVIPNTSSLQTQITNVFVSQSNYTLTSSFQPFTSSIHTFTSSINTQVNNVFLSQSRYTLTSSFNLFTSSIHSFTSSISSSNAFIRNQYITIQPASFNISGSAVLGNNLIVSGNIYGYGVPQSTTISNYLVIDTSSGEFYYNTSSLSGGGGDVYKDGIPSSSQIAYWTGDGTLAGTSSFTFDQVNSTQTIVGKLDIWSGQVSGLMVGGNNNSTLRTNNISKYAKITMPHQLAAEEPSCIIYGLSGGSTNVINIGGGISGMNAATSIRFFVASSYTTLTGTEILNATFGGIVINESGNNMFVRIEGGTDTNLLFISGTNDRIGIGISNPSEKLDVNGTIKSRDTLIISSSLIRNDYSASLNIGSYSIFGVPTSSYDAIFIDYMIQSGSNKRAGTVLGTWYLNTCSFTEYSTMDIGNTSLVRFNIIITGSNAALRLSVSGSNGWRIKTLSRNI